MVSKRATGQMMMCDEGDLFFTFSLCILRGVQKPVCVTMYGDHVTFSLKGSFGLSAPIFLVLAGRDENEKVEV